MAEAAMSDAVKVDSYIGSLISVITKSEIRYEGFLFHLDCKEATMGLRNVKSFGTEGRRKDGPQVLPSEKIYEYVYFRGSDIKDLQVLASASVQNTSVLPDDPAIIQPRHPHPPPAPVSLVSSGAFQAATLSSNAQSGLQAPSFQGNLPPNRSAEVSVSWASMVPAPPPVNVNGPAVPNYWPGVTGLSSRTSHFQRQPFPPPPQGTSGESRGKTSITSLASMHKNLQPGLMESSSSRSLKDGNDDAKIILGSTSDPPPSDSENAEVTAPQLSKPFITKLHDPASSSRYANRPHIQDQGVGMHQSNRGRAQRRGRGNLPNRAAMYSYQSYGGYPIGRGNLPNTTRYPHRHVGSHAHEQSSKVSPSVTRFTEDFDFEAMNQKFNKEEVWGLLGKSKQTEAEDEERDKDGDASDTQDEAHELPKLDKAPVYCKDDFFDSISCRSLDAESGKGKMKLSEQRKIDAETFGEIAKPRHNRGFFGPQRAGNSQGTYRGRGYGNPGGRGYGNAGRGHSATYWNRAA